MTPGEDVRRTNPSSVGQTVSVRIEPGLAKGATAVAPVQDYYVVFWRQPRIAESDLVSGATQERVMWAAAEQYVREAADVHEVIAWAEDEGHSRSAMYTLYAVTSIGDDELLIWLGGVDPTTNGANFERRHPVHVDPVSGTPAEVYRPVGGSQ